MDRRTTIKWVLAAGAVWPVLGNRGIADNSPVASRGYGTDPKLTVDYHPGELWPLTFTAAQRQLAGILSDIIIPADERSPSASGVGVVEFIDEWVSAPYPRYQQDRAVVLGGFSWLDAEGVRRSGKAKTQLDLSLQRAICEDICDKARATADRRDAAHFFALYRDLTAGGFYSTPVGRKDLEYIGNVPLAKFDGPPTELLKMLNLLS
jgi:hypothetical protein